MITATTGCSFENLHLDANGKAGALVNMTLKHDIAFRDVLFTEGIPALFASAGHLTFDNVNWRNCGDGATTAALEFANTDIAFAGDNWFINCCWEPTNGDQINFDSSGAGPDCAHFHFFAPKHEKGEGAVSGVFMKGTVTNVSIWGGHLRNNDAADVINITGGWHKIVGVVCSATTRVINIVGNNNYIAGVHASCTDVGAGANVVITGDHNTIMGLVKFTYGTPYTLTGSYNSAICNHAETIIYGTAAPASGSWGRGAICFNTEPSASGTPGWVCTASGTPGTWKAMGNLAA